MTSAIMRNFGNYSEQFFKNYRKLLKNKKYEGNMPSNSHG
jgi:hypothetical protein